MKEVLQQHAWLVFYSTLLLTACVVGTVVAWVNRPYLAPRPPLLVRDDYHEVTLTWGQLTLTGLVTLAGLVFAWGGLLRWSYRTAEAAGSAQEGPDRGIAGFSAGVTSPSAATSPVLARAATPAYYECVVRTQQAGRSLDDATQACDGLRQGPEGVESTSVAKTHIVEADVVSADATARTLTIKTAQGEATLKVDAVAVSDLKNLKVGERVALTYTEATGPIAIKSIKVVDTPIRPD